ncbi:MAG: NUDIX domain-containing protein [Fimbriimonadaceae bacterium]|jgi:8-oxo-dGTP pyrophosphatase MutT (NUDIX family)|nr:NUDIX domain-containing protein [Fimbriimonadaceae bacterium]
MKEFPLGEWGGESMRFFAAPTMPSNSPFAVLVFPWRGSMILLADILDRGWTIPSGRIQAGEPPESAAHREAWEECGARLQDLTYLGCYCIGETRWSLVFNASVAGVNEIPEAFRHESRETAWFELTDLPEIYSSWNPLIKAVFDYAFSLRPEMQGS